jgi:hypothetical protein
MALACMTRECRANVLNQDGVFGIENTSAATNIPGGRQAPAFSLTGQCQLKSPVQSTDY